MTTLVLDTHVLHWYASDYGNLSRAAVSAVDGADELAVSDVTWWELAWLAQRGRIEASIQVRAWLESMAQKVRTVGVTPAIAATAAALPSSFPRDPADRLIYATAVEHGWQLVTKDQRLRRHGRSKGITIW